MRSVGGGWGWGRGGGRGLGDPRKSNFVHRDRGGTLGKVIQKETIQGKKGW